MRKWEIYESENRGIVETGNRGIGDLGNWGIGELGNQGIGESENGETSNWVNRRNVGNGESIIW